MKRCSALLIVGKYYYNQNKLDKCYYNQNKAPFLTCQIDKIKNTDNTVGNDVEQQTFLYSDGRGINFWKIG